MQTNPFTNWARRRVATLIETNALQISQATTLRGDQSVATLSAASELRQHELLMTDNCRVTSPVIPNNSPWTQHEAVSHCLHQQLPHKPASSSVRQSQNPTVECRSTESRHAAVWTVSCRYGAASVQPRHQMPTSTLSAPHAVSRGTRCIQRRLSNPPTSDEYLRCCQTLMSHLAAVPDIQTINVSRHKKQHYAYYAACRFLHRDSENRDPFVFLQ